MGNKIPDELLLALAAKNSGGGGGGTTNYNDLNNKPKINSVELSGNKTASALGLQDNVNLTLTNDAVVSDRDIQDGQGNTLSVLAEALTKTASGNPVVISDCAGGKARSLKTTINAIQDLHGYDHPWAGGAYKNKLPMTVSGIKALNTAGTWSGNVYTWNGNTFEILTDNANNVLGIKVGGTNNGTPCRFQVCDEGFIGDGSYYLNGSSTEFSGGQTQLYTKYSTTNYAVSYNGADTPFTVSGGYTIGGVYILVDANISFSSPITYRPMIRLSTESDASFAPYSNICPISGRTAVAVDDTGRNIWDEVWEVGAISDTTGEIVGGTRILSSHYIKVSQGVEYYITFPDRLTNDIKLYYYDKNYNYIGTSTWLYRGIVTFADNVAYFRFNIASTYGLTYNHDICINISDASFNGQYAPYAHSSATIQLGQTVYGADINWDTGVMTVKTALKTYTGETDEGWDGDVPTRQYWSTATINNKVKGYIVCNEFKGVQVTTWADLQDNQIALHPTVQNNVRVKYSGAADITAFKAFLASNPMQVEYELATPITIQLTPTMLEMLKGYNRVSIESGTITLDYVAKAISGNDEEIAPLVGDKATKAYAVNDFIERADGLYRVTAPIASGASFTANNTVKMSIGEALTYLYNK